MASCDSPPSPSQSRRLSFGNSADAIYQGFRSGASLAVSGATRASHGIATAAQIVTSSVSGHRKKASISSMDGMMTPSPSQEGPDRLRSSSAAESPAAGGVSTNSVTTDTTPGESDPPTLESPPHSNSPPQTPGTESNGGTGGSGHAKQPSQDRPSSAGDALGHEPSSSTAPTSALVGDSDSSVAASAPPPAKLALPRPSKVALGLPSPALARARTMGRMRELDALDPVKRNKQERKILKQMQAQIRWTGSFRNPAFEAEFRRQYRRYAPGALFLSGCLVFIFAVVLLVRHRHAITEITGGGWALSSNRSFCVAPLALRRSRICWSSCPAGCPSWCRARARR